MVVALIIKRSHEKVKVSSEMFGINDPYSWQVSKPRLPRGVIRRRTRLFHLCDS